MSDPFNYSKWDSLIVSDDSDNEAFYAKKYLEDQVRQRRYAQLLDNKIIPFEQQFEYNSDSFNDDSDFEYSSQSNQPFKDMSFEEFAKSQFKTDDLDKKMETHSKHEIIIKKEIKRLNDLHQVHIQNNANLLKSDYILYIYLEGIKPKIWREIRVPSILSLAAFHDKVLSPLFSWKRNFHSYLFLEQKRSDKRISYGPIHTHSVDISHIGSGGSMFYKLGSIVVNSQFVYLSDVLNERVTTLRYVYDLGDVYCHKIILKEILATDTNKSIVEIINGKKGYPLENTKGNAGFVNRLNKLHDIHIEHKEFEDTIVGLINAPNFDYPKHYYNINIFNVKKTQRKIKKYFNKKLTTQDAMSMLRFPYGKYSYSKHEVAKSYKQGQDYEDSKAFRAQMRGPRICGFCNEWDQKSSGRGRIKIFKCCKGCLNVFYCSRKCQKRDWIYKHKYYCFDHLHF